jgi:(p)ppGpp synthase/HD superfamily hydrolase
MPLRRLLREGQIPHAYQVRGKGSEWRIPHSRRKIANLERAIAIAVDAHRGQKDLFGRPYILHPLRLMLRMETNTERIAAVLHDVVEDSEWTLDMLRKEGFSGDIINALENLTKRKGEDYKDFIKRIETDRLASKVKIADLEDNMDLRRMNAISERDIKRLMKYHEAWLRLQEPE